MPFPGVREGHFTASGHLAGRWVAETRQRHCSVLGWRRMHGPACQGRIRAAKAAGRRGIGQYTSQTSHKLRHCFTTTLSANPQKSAIFM